MTYLWVAIVLLYFPVFVGSLILFDRILRIEYSDHRPDWEADGQPYGFFWVPQESDFARGLLTRFRSLLAHRLTWRSWLFSTPDWVKPDRQALHLLYWWRGLIFGWLALFASFLLALVFHL